MEKVEVRNFYKGKNIFITGGTGFLGKAIIEKLLKSCPDIGNIYILIRPKRGQDTQERLKQLKNNPIFQWIDKEKTEKLFAISGDVSEERLGINDEDMKVLREKVSIILHVAATIKFNEKLEIATQLNLMGTISTCDIAKSLNKLDAFVQISTVYTNYPTMRAEEFVMDSLVEPEILHRFVKTLDPKILRKVEPLLLGDNPNTYIVTKQMAETIVQREYLKGMPVIIVRPAAVSPSCTDPAPGWVDTYDGLNGVLAEVSRGAMRSWYTVPHAIIPIAPLDLCANAAIVGAAYCHVHKDADDIFVVNATTNNITFQKTFDLLNKYSRKIPGKYMQFYPNVQVNHWYWTHLCVQYFKQLFPAYIFDFIARITGRTPVSVKIAKNSIKACKVIEPFSANDSFFPVDNIIKMGNTLNAEEKKIFPVDQRNLNWDKYIENAVIGFRKYLTKDKDYMKYSSQLKRLRIMYMMYRTLKLSAYFYLIYFLIKRFR